MEDLILMKEPLEGYTPSDVEQYLSQRNDPDSVCHALMLVRNQFCWIEDNLYDDPPTTDRATVDAWGKLLDKLTAQIFTLANIQQEDVERLGILKAITPYMSAHGFINQSGWWRKK